MTIDGWNALPGGLRVAVHNLRRDRADTMVEVRNVRPNGAWDDAIRLRMEKAKTLGRQSGPGAGNETPGRDVSDDGTNG